MNKKTTDMIAYITWVGLLIAFIAGDREQSKFHLNQALVVWLVGFLSFLPLVGALIGIAAFVFAVMGVISAYKGEEKPLPLIGGIKLLK